MRKITFSEATREAMAEEMEKYPEVFVMGEDIARQGGIFGQFKGLPDEFPGRVLDTPISETFIVGGGVGITIHKILGGIVLKHLLIGTTFLNPGLFEGALERYVLVKQASI